MLNFIYYISISTVDLKTRNPLATLDLRQISSRLASLQALHFPWAKKPSYRIAYTMRACPQLSQNKVKLTQAF